MENKEALGEGRPRRPSEYPPAPHKKDVATLCAIFLCFVGLLLLISSFASNTWIIGQKIKRGLWVVCAGRTCHWYGFKTQVHVHFTRAFISIAILLSFISFLGYMVSFCCTNVCSVPVAHLSSTVSFLAGFFAMLALTIFTGAMHQHTEKFTYGTGAYTGWVSGPLFFISGAVVSRKTTDAVGRPE